MLHQPKIESGVKRCDICKAQYPTPERAKSMKYPASIWFYVKVGVMRKRLCSDCLNSHLDMCKAYDSLETKPDAKKKRARQA